MPNIPDAPYIVLAERTGFGRPSYLRGSCPYCGGELLPGDALYEWTDGHSTAWICADCFDDRFAALSREERALLIGSERVVLQ